MEGGKQESLHISSIYNNELKCLLLIEATRDFLQMQQEILFPSAMPRNIREADYREVRGNCS